MRAAHPSPRRTAFASAVAVALAVLPLAALAQTSPVAQSLPYTQDFRTLAASSTAYPAGWQGWINGAPGAAYLTTGPTADAALLASSTAATTTGGVHNYNGKIGPLDNGTNDYGLCLALNTTGLSGVVARYEIMTIRNPYDGTTNTRVNEISLQYRAGASGTWTTLAGSEYQNATTLQTSGVVPQKIEYRSVSLPADCDNQPVVQLRWAQRQLSGSGSRPSFAIDNVAVQQPPAGGQATALQFDGVDDYVTFGQAPSLGAQNFTIETWFMRTGAGVVTSTGSGSNAANGLLNVVPLVSKGRGEADGTVVDCNYFLGIQNTPAVVLAADYEDFATSNNNHALVGATVIQNNVWYHAAATYDGATFRLYLNGSLEAQVATTAVPRYDGIQHAGLATAMTSTGAAAGFFQGVLDEARIWNVARGACDIVNSMNLELTAGAGLIARWGMHDGAGSVLGNSFPTPAGILMTGPAWVAGSPFNAPAPPAPADPTGLTATAPDGVQIQLAWVDQAAGESGYEIERSTTGPGGPFSLLATLVANSTAYLNAPLEAGSEYCYRVRAVSCAGYSNYSNVACATPSALCNALQFDPDGAGTDAYVTLGNPAALKLTALTIELWIRRDGPGVGTNTGTGGIPDIIPLVSKGRADAEAAAQDINYLFGIRASDGVLCADFEEGPGGTLPSQNHPVAGTTPIGTGTWRHVAATYDGTTWHLYLDGDLEATLAVGQPLGSASNVAAALASALTLAGAPSGYFDGAMDEVRIWNYARTQSQIQDDINNQITAPTAGLVGRWALDEGAGAAVYGGAGTGIHGAIVGTEASNWSRTACAPFNLTITHDIAASAGPGGTISPAGTTPVPHHGSQTYTIAADPCFVIADVVVDGVSQGPLTAYTFLDVQADHTLAVTFSTVVHTITATAGPGGSIDPAGAVAVNCGANQSFNVTPDPGYGIADVSVDGVSQGAVPSHLFTHVTADHTIAASFVDVEGPTVTVISPNGGENLIVTSTVTLSWTATDNSGSIPAVDLFVSRDNGTSYEQIADDIPNTGTHDWIVTAPGTNTGIDPVYSALLRVEARDAAGLPGADASDGPFSIYDLVVETVVARFEAVPGDQGVVVRWEIATPELFARVDLERGDREQGPWIVVDAERRAEGGMVVAADRAAAVDRSYWYRLSASTRGGSRVTFGPVKAEAAAVRAFALASVAPNPACGPVRVEFAVARESAVDLAVVDVQGRRVTTLFRGVQPAGRYQAIWDGEGADGRVPAGIYFVRYLGGGQVFTRKFVIAR